MNIDSISIVHGVLPVVVIVLGLGALLLALRWKDGTWRRQLLIGVPVAAAVVGLIALLVDGLSLIPYQFPNSYYLWVGLVFLAVMIGIVGWRKFRDWRRAVSIIAIVLTASMAFTLINQHYQYWPTVGALLGKNAQNQVSENELNAIREANKGVSPSEGYTVQVSIPATVSGFDAHDAFVWVPPAWIADPHRKLPVIELLAGAPGAPDNWTRAAYADRTAEQFAATHNGVAPLLVMPDSNGYHVTDSECVNNPGHAGNAETYLTVDVPRYMETKFNAAGTPGSWAIGGLSAGGMCSTMLALRNPDLYHTFADFSGLEGPTVGETMQPALTTEKLFGGSTEAYDAHDPQYLLTHNRYPQLSGWFEVGTDDAAPLAAQQQLVPLARQAGIKTCASELPGGQHDFDTWAKMFQQALPWLSYQVGLTGAPGLPADTTCTS
jgi:S-formylglutathione hydrolase FrmB